MANPAYSRGRFFPVQSVHLGQAGSFSGFNQATLGTDLQQGAGSTTGWNIGGQLGLVVEDSGVVYRLVQINNTTGVVTAAGDCVYFKDTSYQVVTSKATESVAAANAIAGGTLGAITSAQSQGNYVYVQIGGIQTLPTNSGSTVAGDQLSGDGTNNKQLVRTAAGTASVNLIVAIAVGSASGGNNAASSRWVLGAML